jgi:hypothetical protein
VHTFRRASGCVQSAADWLAGTLLQRAVDVADWNLGASVLEEAVSELSAAAAALRVGRCLEVTNRRGNVVTELIRKGLIPDEFD